MRKQWAQEYISNYIKANPEANPKPNFGGAWYCANLLGKFYLYGATER
jgi:hypothetical protein